MKRIFIFLVAFVATTTLTFASETTTYKGNLVAKTSIGIKIAEESDVQVLITKNDDDTYQIDLKNFKVSSRGSTFYIGNITVASMTATESAGTITIESKAGNDNNITFTEGDNPTGVDWYGVSILNGGAKGDVSGTITGDKVSLVIPIQILGTIDVKYDGTKVTPSAINSISANVTQVIPSVGYNLAGQQVSPNTKGLIIKNGKKYIK